MPLNKQEIGDDVLTLGVWSHEIWWVATSQSFVATKFRGLPGDGRAFDAELLHPAA